jgi:hypothetical protein
MSFCLSLRGMMKGIKQFHFTIYGKVAAIQATQKWDRGIE